MFDDFFSQDNSDGRAQVASFLIACFKRALDSAQKKANRVVARSFDLSSTSGDGANGQIDVVMPDDWTPGTCVVENPNANGVISVYRDGIVTGLPYATVPANVAKVIPVAPETKRMTLKWDNTVVNTGTLQVWLMESAIGYDEFGVSGSGGGGTVANPSVTEVISGANGNVATVDAHGSQQTTIADSTGAKAGPLQVVGGVDSLPVALFGDQSALHQSTPSGLMGSTGWVNTQMLDILAAFYGITNQGHGAVPLVSHDGNGFNNGTGSALVATGGESKINIAAAAAAAAVFTRVGRLCKVQVLATGTAAVNFYDNNAASGTIVGRIPANAAEGTIYDFNIPCDTGLFAGTGAGSPQLLVSYI